MIYIICFSISVLFAYFDTRDEQKKNIGIYGWIAILLPAVLAGIRDLSVGTDTVTYASEFIRISGQTFSQFVTTDDYMEIGFRFLFFVVSRFTDNPNWGFFAAHLFIMFFIYDGLIENGARRSTWLGLMIFYLMFFSTSLNILRQYMASAMLVWGFKYVKKEKVLSWLAVIVLAALFHRTSVVAIFIYYLYKIYFIKTDGIYKNGIVSRIKPEIKTVISFFILAGALMIFLYARPIIRLVHEITGKFGVQANTIRDYFAVDMYDAAYKAAFLMPFVLFRRSEANSNGDCDFYSIIFALCMILSQLNMVSYNAARIIEPYWIQLVLAIPILISGLKNKTNRIVISGYYLLLCGWVYLNNFVIKGYSEVMPYTSGIFGIG